MTSHDAGRDTHRRVATPGERAYAVYFRQTYPMAPYTPGYAWQLLATDAEGQRQRALWDAMAQAVLRGPQETRA